MYRLVGREKKGRNSPAMSAPYIGDSPKVKVLQYLLSKSLIISTV
jgi:hypothetical protein